MSIGRWIKKIPIKNGNYLPVEEDAYQFRTELARGRWQLRRKVPIKKLKNVSSRSLVTIAPMLDAALNLIKYFTMVSWYPIAIDDEYNVIDGQMRLLIAHLLGLKFIDVEIYTKPSAALECLISDKGW